MNTLDLLKLFYISGFIIWCLPPIRQFKGRFFDFFLVLAFIDPVALVYGILIKTNIPMWLTVLFIYLLILSIYSESALRRFKYIFIIIPLVFVLSIPFQTQTLYFIIVIGELAILLLLFLKELVVSYVAQKRIDLFYLMLVFYMSTNILKYFNLIIGFADATAFFIITTFTQIAFGLFFSIVRKD